MMETIRQTLADYIWEHQYHEALARIDKARIEGCNSLDDVEAFIRPANISLDHVAAAREPVFDAYTVRDGQIRHITGSEIYRFARRHGNGWEHPTIARIIEEFGIHPGDILAVWYPWEISCFEVTEEMDPERYRPLLDRHAIYGRGSVLALQPLPDGDRRGQYMVWDITRQQAVRTGCLLECGLYLRWALE